jgi:hypothetical protein
MPKEPHSARFAGNLPRDNAASGCAAPNHKSVNSLATSRQNRFTIEPWLGRLWVARQMPLSYTFFFAPCVLKCLCAWPKELARQKEPTGERTASAGPRELDARVKREARNPLKLRVSEQRALARAS